MSEVEAKQEVNKPEAKVIGEVSNEREDETVYKRGQQNKWTRARKGDKTEGDKKRARREQKERDYTTTEYKPRVDENGNPLPKSERKPKKKVACMIGYCGTGYNGMQIQNNPDVKTIEGDLFKAFVKAGAISPENADDLKKNGFMRAARTDKGVHAAGNVISCKLIIEDEDILKRINEELPEQIRIWGIERTNRSFDCRKMCSSRVYEYLLPTYTLLPPKPHSVLSDLIESKRDEAKEGIRDDQEGKEWWNETQQAILDAGITQEDVERAQKMLTESSNSQGESKVPLKLYNENGEPTEEGKLVRSIKAVENKRRRAFKASEERLRLFRESLKQYEGSHNFHNFTIGKSYNDAAARRYMKDTTVSEPFVINENEWVSIKIHGQSFMLHQIRKMIAMAVLVVRTGCPLTRIQDCFGPTKVNIPKAPALGLLLENPVYEGYNAMLEKFGYNKIDFSKYKEEMDAFKMKYIYDKIYDEEVRENVFQGFFGFVDTFKGNLESNEGKHVFDFLGSIFDSGLDANGEVAKQEKNTDSESSTKPQDNVD